MTDTTATFDVTSFDGRIVPLDACRRAVRLLVDGVVVGLGTVAAIFALVTTVTVGAAWIINAALATHPTLNAQVPIAPTAIALTRHDRAWARAEDVTGSTGVSTGSAVTFDAQWVGATTPVSARTDAVARVLQHLIERESAMAALAP